MKTYFFRFLLLFIGWGGSFASIAQQPSVDWGNAVGPLRPEMWSVNEYEILNPAAARDTALQRYLAVLHPALIRIHEAGLADTWTNSATRTWDVAKIQAGFAASTGYARSGVMLNIPKWPGWLAPTNAPLPANKEDEFAALVAALVPVMRDQVRQPIAYWELMNEVEDMYENAGRLSDLWRLWNNIAARIKRADPQAKVGGTAPSWAKPDWINGFVSACGANADFMTYHWYAGGPNSHTDAQLMADDGGWYAGNMMGVKRTYPNMKIFLTEYNVQWSWEPFEVRHANSVGAVWQALSVKRQALKGLDGMFVWHAKGNAYGLIDGDNKLRATGALYRWASQYLIGTLASHAARLPGLELLPVSRPDGSRALLLLNTTNGPISVANFQTLLGGRPVAQIQRIDDQNWQPVRIAPFQGTMVLPQFSLTLVTAAAPLATSAAQATAPDARALAAYPNPSPAGRLTVALEARQAQTARLTVHDAQGHLVGAFVVPVRAGHTDFQVPATLPRGLYFLSTTLDGQAQKFTVHVE